MAKKLDQTYTKERLQLVLESTRLGMWDWNPQTNEVLFDEIWASMLGVQLSDLSMTLDDWSSRVHPDDIDACFADITAHIEGRTTYYENLHRMRHASGEWVYILDRGRVVEFDADGRPVRFTGTHSDLTPLKKAEFEASLSVKARERFFASVSHELRAPLHAIGGIHRQLLDVVQSESQRSLLHLASEATESLVSLVNDLLDASAISFSGIEPRKERIDTVELVNNLVALYERRFDEKELALTLDVDGASLPSGSCFVLTDANRLKQILTNLLSNALKFTNKGKVMVRLGTQEDGSLAIEIQDTGSGIADTEVIFQPFFSDGADTEEYDSPNSTGLGLYIVRELSQVLGFALTVSSEVGKGSIFTLGIPRERVSVVRSNYKDEQRQIAPQCKNKVFLIVGDEPTNRRIMVAFLQATQAELHTVRNGEQALDMADQLDHLDAVFTDLHMPQVGGLTLCEKLRQRDRFRELPVIIMSADSKANVWERCVAAGVADYLQKPFDAEQVFSAIKALGLE